MVCQDSHHPQGYQLTGVDRHPLTPLATLGPRMTRPILP